MDIEERVRRVIAEQLGLVLSAVTDEKKIVEDLGADSLDEIEIVMALEEEFALEICDDDAVYVRTVKEAIALVKKEVETQA